MTFGYGAFLSTLLRQEATRQVARERWLRAQQRRQQAASAPEEVPSSV
jgi:hypothetical protein